MVESLGLVSGHPKQKEQQVQRAHAWCCMEHSRHSRRAKHFTSSEQKNRLEKVATLCSILIGLHSA